MRLIAATWPEVETYLKTKNALILPLGSTEQHGPSGLIGTDTHCADAVARETAERLGMLVAPPLWYGMSSHHMAFPGSATLRPSVYQLMLVDVIRGFYRHGFRRFYLVNGHGGNEASVRAAFQELKHDGLESGLSGAALHLFNWWKLPEVAQLADELFGKEEGSHATPTEVSLSFYLENITERPYTRVPEPGECAWPMTPDEMRKGFVTGTMRSNPGLARGEYGKRILEVASDAMMKAIRSAPVLE